MQWSQIKTLFILSFLVLDIYLIIQFMDKQEQTDLSVMEEEDKTIEEQLEAEDISVPKLPGEEAEEDEHYISVSPRHFSEEDLEDLEDKENQSPELIDDRKFIVSIFDEPISIPEGGSAEEIEEVIKNEFLFPDEYIYWDWNEEQNVLIFFQQKKDRPIYYNENGIATVFLNEENEAIFFTQTMLDEAESTGDTNTLIKPIEAIKKLYDSNEFNTGDEITEVDMGFHTRIPLESGVLVFSPTWRVTVNDEQNYFVNAIEGAYSSINSSFLKETLRSMEDKVEKMSDDEQVREDILESLEKRLQDSEGSEQEE